MPIHVVLVLGKPKPTCTSQPQEHTAAALATFRNEEEFAHRNPAGEDSSAKLCTPETCMSARETNLR